MFSPPDPVDTFYIVVPVDTQSATEGSYGFASDGTPRAPATEACYTQVVQETCE